MTGRSVLSNRIDNINNHVRNGRIRSAATIRPSSVNALKKNHHQQNIRPKSPNHMNLDMVRPKSSARSRPKTSIPVNMSFNLNIKGDQTIEDQEMIENLKGTLIRTVYTDRDGRHLLDQLPHDTYLIEIENSKNFIGSAMIYKMNFIIENNGPKSLGMSSKLIGLKRQTDAYVSVYISFINNLENYDFSPVKDCQISLRKITENTTDAILEQGI